MKPNTSTGYPALFGTLVLCAACGGSPEGHPTEASGTAPTSTPAGAGGTAQSGPAETGGASTTENGTGGSATVPVGASGASNGSGAGGEPGSGGGGPVTPASMPPCMSKPSEIAILGDSYVTGAVSPALQPALGMLDPDANQFRNYAVPGTSMATGGLAGTIPPQLDLAVAADPDLRLLIMDGAGNDILLCDGVKFPGCGSLCHAAGSSQQKICTDIVSTAFDATKQLFGKAADAGVRDVVYFFYPHVPSSLGGYKEIIDYAEPLARALCDGTRENTGGRLTCHFVPLVRPFEAAGGDLNPLNFSFDGIHPSAAGQAIIAKEIAGVLDSECLAKPASSGCCEG